MTILELEKRYPFIHWHEPISITVVGQPTRLGCRVCIAEKGLCAPDVATTCFTERADFDQHLKIHA